MRYDFMLAIGALGFALNQGAMVLGHCAMIAPQDHRSHEAMGHGAPEPDEAPAEDGMKGCHACLRKRTLPIKG